MTILRAQKDRENPYVQINRKMFDDPALSLKAKGFIGYCLSKKDDWRFYVTQLADSLKEGKDSIYSTIKEVEKEGYCIKYQKRDVKGRIITYEYVISDSKAEIQRVKEEMEEELKNKVPKRENPVVDNPLKENPPLITMTKAKTESIENKGNVLDAEKTLPFASAKRVNDKAKFPLKKEQRPYFERMQALNLGTDDDTLIILIRDAFKKGNVALLDKAISHIQAEREKGTEFKKEPIALFRSVLNGKISPISEQAKANKLVAEKCKTKYQWHSLVIKDKYVSCEKTDKEVPTDISKADFLERLQALHELSQVY